MLRTKRYFSLVSLLVAVVVVLSACGSGSGSGSSASSSPSGSGSETPGSATPDSGKADAKITMWTFLDPNGTSPREVALKQIIDNFERDNPGITVSVEPQTWDTLGSKFLAAHHTNTAPDIIWVTMDDFGTALNQDALADFEGLFLNEWSEEDLADVDDSYWTFGNKDGKHYQFTLSRNYIGLLYREDLLAEKGIEVPFKTWDDLISAAQELTETDESTGMQRYGLGMALSTSSPDPQIFPPALIYAQGDMFTADGKANWSTEAGVEALNLQLDMIRKYNITPESAVSASVEDMYNEFKAGRYAMIIGAGVRIPNLQTDSTFDGNTIQMTYFPSTDGASFSPSVVNGWNVGVWSGSSNKEAAGKFVEYLVNPESDEIWMLTGGQVPVRKSTMEKNKDFIDQPNNQYLQIMSDGIANYGYAQPWEFPVSGWRSDLNDIAQKALVGGQSELQALQAGEAEFNKRSE